MLEAKNISKKYKKREILSSINLKLFEGEILGILGPNGVGKTTLLNIIMGFIKEDRGEVFIAGEKINTLPVHKRVQKGLSYLTQDVSVIEELTVEDNIKAVLQLLKIEKDKFSTIITEYLEEFELVIQSKQKAQTLSGGERRKLEIILSLLTNPKFILFDEPFTGLDPKTIKELHRLILILKEKNIGVLIVDHNYTEVMNKADRVCLILEGKVFFEGTPENFVKNRDVITHYLGT